MTTFKYLSHCTNSTIHSTCHKTSFHQSFVWISLSQCPKWCLSMCYKVMEYDRLAKFWNLNRTFHLDKQLWSIFYFKCQLSNYLTTVYVNYSTIRYHHLISNSSMTLQEWFYTSGRCILLWNFISVFHFFKIICYHLSSCPIPIPLSVFDDGCSHTETNMKNYWSHSYHCYKLSNFHHVH